MKKIINDPVHGFITIESPLIFDLINHPIFQRLRRIRQGGLVDLIYTGAVHTRFQHALGAMFLMSKALQTLRNKKIEISDKEFESALIAILLHDLGHSPLSHSLEGEILQVNHERLSGRLMQVLNKEFGGELEIAIQIFEGTYKRAFFHQLVSGQIDMDRMDYIQRDSYFTGVSEATIDSDRLIGMMNVWNDSLVLEEKSIYSIEHFLNSRRLMYWQVYLHKTNLCLQEMLTLTIRCAKYLLRAKKEIGFTENLAFFLQNDVKFDESENIWLPTFISLDDYDVWSSLKNAQHHSDSFLSFLSKSLMQRDLFRIESKFETFTTAYQQKIRQEINQIYGKEADLYMFSSEKIRFSAYEKGHESIEILLKNQQILSLENATDWTNIDALTKNIEKYYLCYPKNVYLQHN